MLFMKMDLLNYQYLDKMNNNIGILCYEGEAALRGEPRMQTIPVASALTSHRTGPPPISPSKRKFGMEPGDDDLDCENDHASKISRIFNPHLTFGLDVYGHAYQETTYSANSTEVEGAIPHFKLKLDSEEIEQLPLC